MYDGLRWVVVSGAEKPRFAGGNMSSATEAAVPVTYASNATSQATAQLAHVIPLLAEQMPLRNLHWRPSSSVQTLKPVTKPGGPSTMPALRTILHLPVDLVPLASHIPNSTSIPVLKRLPMVHLYFVVCDDSDVYRAQVRNEIRHWLATIRQHSPTDFDDVPLDERASTGPLPPEHLIVLVPPPAGVFASSSTSSTSKGAMGRFYTMNKGTVLEKMRADFNSNTKEHVVALSRLPTSSKDNDPAIWIDLIARMKECTLASIGRLIELQDRVVSLHDTTRYAVHWSLSGSMLRREQIVQTLEGLGLVPDALHVYDTIEQLLSYALTSGRTRFTIGGTEVGDDSTMLLGPLRKPYMTLMAQNKLSLFDMHCYLYARRSLLLAAMGHIVPVMQRTSAFIATVTRMLRPHRHFLARGFLESWSFSVALDAVEQCQLWFHELYGDSPDVKAERTFHAAKAELLEVGVRQLVRLGIHVGHAPREEPFTFIESGAVSLFSPDAHISRPEMAESLSDKRSLDQHLRRVMHRTLQAASLCDQTARTLRVKYLLAHWHMHCDSMASARELWDELLAAPTLVHTSSYMYGAVHAARLACIEAQDEAHGDTWIQALTDAIQARCERRMQPMPALDEMKLLSMLVTAAEAQDRDATLVGYNGLAVHVCGDHAHRDGDAVYVDVEVRSLLPTSLAVDGVHIWLANYRQMQLQCSSEPCTLEPGVNRLRLVCSTSAVGYFHLQATQVRIQRIMLESITQSAPTVSTLSEAQQQEYMRPRVCIAADGDALYLDLRAPRETRLEARRSVWLHIESGRRALDSASIVLRPYGDVTLDQEAVPTTVCAPPETQVSRAPTGNLVLHRLPAHSTCVVSLPISHLPRAITSVQVHASCQYCSGAQHGTFHTLLHAPISLPFGINIQDHFRLDTLLSKLALEAQGGMHVRVCAPQVTSDSDTLVRVRVPETAVPLRLAPRETATYLLHFEQTQPHQHRSADTTFSLTITYRTAADEAQSIALYVLATHLAHTAPDWAQGDQGLLERALCASVSNATFGPLTYDSMHWHNVIHRWGWRHDSERARQVLQLVQRIFADLADPSLDAMQLPLTPNAAPPRPVQPRAWAASRACLAWRILTLPLDVPFVDTVNAVRIRPPMTSHVMLGEPMRVTFDTTVSFAWAKEHTDDNEPLLLQYHILSDYDNWLVWGTKKGTWSIDNRTQHSHYTIRATLVPVRTGWLLYPRLRITPMGPATRPFRCETYMRHAGQGIHVVSPPQPDTYWVDLRPNVQIT